MKIFIAGLAVTILSGTFGMALFFLGGFLVMIGSLVAALVRSLPQ